MTRFTPRFITQFRWQCCLSAVQLRVVAVLVAVQDCADGIFQRLLFGHALFAPWSAGERRRGLSSGELGTL